MKRLRKILILMMTMVITTSCDQGNVLSEYSKKDSDEALYLEAVKKMDNSDWDGAITIFTTTLSPAYRAQTKVKENLMYSYGGKCGISFFDMVSKLKGMNSTKIFEIALRLFEASVVNVSACDNAVGVLHSLGATAAQRTNSQNLFAAILGVTRMGTALHAKLDTDSSGLGDGSVDAGVTDLCTNSNANHYLTDADLDKVISGVGLIFENLSALGDQLTSGTAGGAFDAAKTLCETAVPLPSLATPGSLAPSLAVYPSWAAMGIVPDPTYQSLGLPNDISEPLNCFNTDTAAVTPKMRRVFRRMLQSSSLGYGSCDISSVVVNVTGGMSPQIQVTMNCCPALDKP